MRRTKYAAPYAEFRRQRMTLKQFLLDFERYLNKDPEFENAVILDAAVLDDSGNIYDGAVVFRVYLQEEDCEGTFTVPVSEAKDIQ